jgi:aspartyl-tRNA(Asn)/glutamyl-tRNA(Gln) amidotransferase subunit A
VGTKKCAAHERAADEARRWAPRSRRAPRARRRRGRTAACCTLPRMATAREIAHDVRTGRRSAVDVAAEALTRAEASQERTNAFVTIAHDRALAAAARVDDAVRAGRDPGALAGVPVAIKDNICTQGLRTTAGSDLLRSFVPPYDATVVARLEAAGAVVVGKTNLDAFGMGSSSEHSAFGAVRHPLDEARVAGGSSGGSAAAVAAGVVPLALGTDTGGSVRQPAAFCGVVGVKPTYGRLSRSGVIAYASSLDQVGVLAGDVADARLALRVMAGRDPLDATSVDAPALAPEDDELDLAGVRVGVIAELTGDGVSPGVGAALAAVRDRLVRAGATVVAVSLPSVRFAVAAYYVVATAEASSNLARYDAMLYGERVAEGGGDQERVMRRSRAAGLGREVQRRILMGTYALSAGWYEAYYGRASQVRRLIADEIAAALRGVDVLLSPTAPTVAWRLGERLADPLAMYLGDVTTCIANLAGSPAVSVPAGTAEDGLPCGAQLLGAAFEEDRLLALAARLARAEPASRP